jgi:ELWxxDGT repeat protein
MLRVLHFVLGLCVLTASLVFAESNLVVTPLLSFHGELSNSSNPTQLTNAGRLTVFAAAHPKFGEEPWVTDGTSMGTILLKNISTLRSSRPTKFIAVNKFIYFFATGNDGKRGLWKSDGTPASTKLISKNITDERLISCESSLGNHLLIFQDGTGMWNINTRTDQISLVKNIQCNGSVSAADALFLQVTR